MHSPLRSALATLASTLLMTLVALAAGAQEARSAAPLGEKLGRKVLLVGRISSTPWQHMILGDTKKQASYVDLDGGGQTVVYAVGFPECHGPILFRGTVLRIDGNSKRPGAKDVASETQLDADSWRCLDALTLSQQLDRMAAPSVPETEKEELEDALGDAGKEAIPTLLDHIEDRRVVRKVRVLLNEGELTNRPAGGPPVEERWGEEVVTVGARCQEILYRIVTPRGYHPPHAGNFKPFSAGTRPFRVEDWGRWWARVGDKSLGQIRKELEPVLDAYWKTHGTQQVVR